MAQPESGGSEEASLPLSRILENLADEIAVALAICVNVEEIIADHLLAGGTESNFVRVELQNVDRLIQMLGDFRGITHGLAAAVGTHEVKESGLRGHLIMEEMARRLLSEDATRRDNQPSLGSDMTFF